MEKNTVVKFTRQIGEGSAWIDEAGGESIASLDWMAVNGDAHDVKLVTLRLVVAMDVHPLDRLMMNVSVESSNSKDTAVFAETKGEHAFVDDLSLQHCIVNWLLMFALLLAAHTHS